MIRMLQLSLVLARVAQRGRIGASNAAFVGTHLQSRRKASSHIITTASSNANDDDGGNDGTPIKSTRVGRRTIHQSRLASTYDEMFGTDDVPPTPTPKVNTQEDYEFTETSTLESARDFNLDDDYPQGLAFEPTPSFPPKPAPIRASPPVVPTVKKQQFPQVNIKPPKAAVSSPPVVPTASKPQFSKANVKPPQAAAPRMIMGRLMPPSVMEYDYSHYDEEFGSAQPGENSYTEFHDGMLEEMDNSGSNSLQASNDAVGILSDEPQVEESTQLVSTEDIEQTTNVEETMNSKQEFIPEKRTWVSNTKPPLRFARADVPTDALSILKLSNTGSGEVNQLNRLQEQLDRIQSEIYKLNNDEEFNINSPKQVSKVVFGDANESANKVALEALAGNISNSGGQARLASLILKYRKFAFEIKRMGKEKENKANGSHVSSVSGMRNGKDQAVSKAATVVSPLGSPGDEREPLVLVDASAYIFRAYYSMPAIHRDDGEPTGTFSRNEFYKTVISI